MEIPETLATLDTPGTGRRQLKQKNTTEHHKPSMNAGSREW
jgi:hypothetical protein